MATRKVTKLPVTEKTVCLTNADQNRATIDRVVIHTMVGTIASANTRFNDPASKVSAHYGVGYDGSIVHWVDEDWVAYQAGNYPMNQRSIGIEHEDMGKYNDPRPDALYESSAKLVADICTFYNIPIDSTHVIPHREVTATACPDALDVERIIRQASQMTAPQSGIVTVSDPAAKIDLSSLDNATALGEVYGIMELSVLKSKIIAKDQKIADLLKTPQIAPQNSTDPIPLPYVDSPAPFPDSQSSETKNPSLVRWVADLVNFILGKNGK